MNEEIESLKEELDRTRLAYQIAVRMGQFKGGFLTRVSHELRSPLSSLMALHKLILSDLCEGPEEERNFLLSAYDRADKLMKIIDNILSVSQIESGVKPLEIVPLQLSKILSDLGVYANLQANNANLKLKISSPDPELFVLADRACLQQALFNPIDAAIFWMKQSSVLGEIRVSTQTSSDSIEIEVDIDCPASIWSEPANLLDSITPATPESVKSFSKTLELSPGMKFLLSMQLIETIGGKLLLLPLPSEKDKATLTRLQFLIPLAPVAR